MEINIKTNSNSFDYYRLGEEFRMAAFCCQGSDKNGNDMIIDNGQFCFLPSAMVVNAAFSCEMFLKSLLVHSSVKYGKSHNLYDLFQLLPTNVKEKAAEYCTKGNINNLENILKQHAMDFKDARYYVEKKTWYGMNPLIIKDLAFNLSQATKFILSEKESS